MSPPPFVDVAPAPITGLAAPKLTTDRAKEILSHAIHRRSGALLLRTEEVEALAQEVIDARGALACVFEMTDAELDAARGEVLALLLKKRR